LVQQLHESTLNLAIGRGAFRKPLSADCIDFVHEDDAWGVLTSVRKHFFEKIPHLRSSPKIFSTEEIGLPRMTRALSPMYLSTMAEETTCVQEVNQRKDISIIEFWRTLRNEALRLEARARARRVLPVPGGPYNKTPYSRLR
jgi:hypothetical protein